MHVFHFDFFSRGKRREDPDERAKMARLESAEAELSALQARAGRAIRALNARQERNHWQESVAQMIRGAPHV